MVPPGATVLLDDARAIVARDGMEAAPVVLGDRSVYRTAWPRGEGVSETEPRGKAASEIAALMKWVFEQLQVCTPARETIEETARG